MGLLFLFGYRLAILFIQVELRPGLLALLFPAYRYTRCFARPDTSESYINSPAMGVILQGRIGFPQASGSGSSGPCPLTSHDDRDINTHYEEIRKHEHIIKRKKP